MNGGVLRQTHEVDVERTVGDRVEGNVLGERAHLLAAHFNFDDRVEEVTGAELTDQLLFLDVDRYGAFLGTIDNGGDATFTTQSTGGSLACPFARLGRHYKRIAHENLPFENWISLGNRPFIRPVPPITPPGMTTMGRAAPYAQSRTKASFCVLTGG